MKLKMVIFTYKYQLENSQSPWHLFKFYGGFFFREGEKLLIF